MLKYPMADIGNSYYNYYVYRYGCFLKNIRYEEYDVNCFLFRFTKHGHRVIGLDHITSISFPTTKSS